MISQEQLDEISWDKWVERSKDLSSRLDRIAELTAKMTAAGAAHRLNPDFNALMRAFEEAARALDLLTEQLERTFYSAEVTK